MALIEARDLVKSYTMGDQTVHALRGVSLDITEGDFVAIMGDGANAIGNPLDILIGEDLNQAERAQAIARLGLDQPLWQQY